MASKTVAATVTTVAQQQQQTEQGKGAKSSALRRLTGEAVGPCTAYPSLRRCLDVTSQNFPQSP
jgi:hypothetical protein